jgi:hypothetical protein
MELSNKFWITVLALGVLLGALYFTFRGETMPAPSGETLIADGEGENTEVAVTFIPVEQSTAQAPSAPAPSFVVNKKDTIASWKFTGRYAGNETLTINAQTDIARLQSLLGTGEYQDYDLYVGIGNDYTYLGDGEKAFAAYKKAVTLDPNRAVVYMNIGNLMEQMEAYNTAKDAYAKAVAVEPDMPQYKNAQADFLERLSSPN